jgi:MoaA/NifB/PqqE/SkfB family radical SAM enzyme
VRSAKDIKVRLGPSGIHLFHRRSGLNVLLDEILPPETFWSLAPRQVSIALTNACDLTCAHCYAPKVRASIPLNRLLIWIKELDENGALGVGFGGGEPTLYPHFVPLCAYIYEHTRLAVTFTTHGHHLNERLVDALGATVNFVRISMDGVGETYERIRKRSFDALCDRIQAVGRLLPFGINYLVNEHTLKDLDAALRIATNLNASEFLLLPEQPANDRFGVDPDTMQNLNEWIRSYSGPVRLAISDRNSGGIPVCDPMANELGLRDFAHIDARGVLKRSSFDLDGIVIGPDGLVAALHRLRQPGG